MKILQIHFKNIHSLKGEHLIDFEQEPLQSAGLFAITGATGSGKSTILDVITLALFNEIPRFDKKISNNEIEKLGSVVTHFTDESWAEISFETRAGRFRSRWEISKAKTGNWRNYEMSITDLLTQKALPLKKSEVPGKNEELIGLNYSQFVKSIVLSQGEFAKFLKADSDERSKLLEDITGTYIYRDIGLRVFEMAKAKNQELLLLQEGLKNIHLLEEEEKELVLQEKKSLEEQIHLLLATAKKKQQEKEAKLLQTEVVKDRQEIKELESNLHQKNKLFAEAEKKLKKHLEIFPLVSDFDNMSRLQTSIAKESKAIQEHQKSIQDHEKHKKTILEEANKLIDEEVNETHFQEQIYAFEKRVLAYDNRLLEIQNQGKGLRERIQNQVDKGQTEIKEVLQDKLQAQDQLKHIDSRLALIQSEKGSDAKVIRAEQQVNRAELTQLDKFGHIISHKDVLKKALEKLQDEIATSQLELKNQQEKSILSDENILKLEAELEQKEKAQTEAMRKAELEDYRAELNEGEACPLCGSVEHPYLKHLELANVGTLTIEIKSIKQALKSAQSNKESLVKFLAKLESKEQLAKEQFQKLEKELVDNQAILQSMLAEYAFLQAVDVHSIDAAKALRENKIQTLETQLNHLEEINLLESIRSEFKTLGDLMNQYSLIKDERKLLYDGANISAEVRKLLNQFQAVLAALEKEKSFVMRSEQDKLEAEKELQIIIQKLNTALQDLPYDSIETARNQLLSNAEVQEIQEESKSISNLETQIKTLANRLQIKETRLASMHVPEEELETIQSTLNKLEQDTQSVNKALGAIDEKLKHDVTQREQFDAKSKAIEKAEVSNRKFVLLNEMIGDAKGKKFSNFAQELTLKNLLVLANARLEDMNDRYVLHYDSDSGELQVFDQYQGNTLRAVKTLSGGESFILSLALALSLSDLASKNVHLDCLFIDEGFGTLDPETLDMALSTLEKLQDESGKMIGVISHVASLKERIQTQIRVEKNRQGYSHIRIQ